MGRDTNMAAISLFRGMAALTSCENRELFSNALGDTAYSQEHLKTMVYAKFGGQTKCIMGNSKIENRRKES